MTIVTSAPNNASTLARLVDTECPAGFRVLHSKDPITSEKGADGKHVGKKVYVNTPRMLDSVSRPDFSTHEPGKIRDLLLENLSDPDIPALGMRYRDMSDINPTRDNEKKGSIEELQKMAAALKQYYSDNGIWFDSAVFDRNVAIRMEIERSSYEPPPKTC